MSSFDERASRVQEALERVLSRYWKAGKIDRSDEERMPVLRNTAGFARQYTLIMNGNRIPVLQQRQLFNELWSYGLGMGTFHPGKSYGGTLRQRYPTEYGIARDASKAMVKAYGQTT